MRMFINLLVMLLVYETLHNLRRVIVLLLLLLVASAILLFVNEFLMCSFCTICVEKMLSDGTSCVSVIVSMFSMI